ncbi:MAG TPA: hypothetical protein VFJ30_01580, partial [Phycisphaerae bacterium]|nr:hypothetical protein [Phycisphaerae bacterium]
GAGAGQPRQPIRIVAVGRIEADKVVPAGEPLKLEPPYFRSFDATAAVRAWLAAPAANRGLALLSAGGIDPRDLVLDVWYEGKPANLPPQVEGLHAAHANGQTFLVWKELPEFRPPADKVLWLERFDYRKPQLADGPGQNAWGGPRVGAVTLATLRDLEGFAVRTEKGPGQRLADQKRVKDTPDVQYRIYRSPRAITADNIGSAEWVGVARPLNAYDDMMIMGGHIACRGEYYDQQEIPDSIFKTWCHGDGQAVAPGEAFFAFTLPEGSSGEYFYAVTAWKAGVENLSAVSDANSLPAPVAEKAAIPKPVLQHIRPDTVHIRPKEKTTEYWYAFFLGPPVSNIPQMDPRRIVVEVPEAWKAPGALQMTTTPGGAFWDTRVATDQQILLYIQQDVGYGGDLGYNEGRGTLKAFAGSQVRFYSEKYLFTVLDWALSKWRADRSRIGGGASTHFSARHPEFFGALMMGPPFASGYSLDFDQKWNPASGSLGSNLGPVDLVKGPDGESAWDMFDLCKYLRANPGKDIPFMGCMFSQPKDGNHGAEYGWQDDPKGLAALRDARQPYAATWGGAGLPGEVSKAYAAMRWDKTLPAFSNCSLDNNPGTGDPDAGDPWGQINAWLLWDGDGSAEAADRWEMTVWLAAASPADTCTVDVTPRHCKGFRPAAGQAFQWTITSSADGKVIANGTVQADQWGLTTLKRIPVAKDPSRIVIRKP